MKTPIAEPRRSIAAAFSECFSIAKVEEAALKELRYV